MQLVYALVDELIRAAIVVRGDESGGIRRRRDAALVDGPSMIRRGLWLAGDPFVRSFVGVLGGAHRPHEIANLPAVAHHRGHANQTRAHGEGRLLGFPDAFLRVVRSFHRRVVEGPLLGRLGLRVRDLLRSLRHGLSRLGLLLLHVLDGVIAFELSLHLGLALVRRGAHRGCGGFVKRLHLVFEPFRALALRLNLGVRVRDLGIHLLRLSLERGLSGVGLVLGELNRHPGVGEGIGELFVLAAKKLDHRRILRRAMILGGRIGFHARVERILGLGGLGGLELRELLASLAAPLQRLNLLRRGDLLLGALEGGLFRRGGRGW